jgi:hypothetical protein
MYYHDVIPGNGIKAALVYFRKDPLSHHHDVTTQQTAS